MLDADNVIFHLQRFEWASPGRLELSGLWEGLGPDRDVAAPALIARSDHGARRIEAVPSAAKPVRDGRWLGVFDCGQETLQATGMELDTGMGLVLELPLPTRVGTHPDGAEPRSSPDSHEPLSLDRNASPVDLYIAAVELRRELDDVRAALERADEELVLARGDAERQRELRRSESARMSAAMQTARSLAAEELGRLRAELAEVASVATEADDLRAALQASRRDLREEEAAREMLLARLSEVRHAFSEAT